MDLKGIVRGCGLTSYDLVQGPVLDFLNTVMTLGF
jgi:hypothetical protein